MAGFPSPFSGSADAGGLFDTYDEFVAEHLPEPARFLNGHDILTGDDHVAFHRLTKDIFDVRGVYDMTFGYNLAQLNLDTRHPEAGYRYAVESDDPSVLRAEFTPTTRFCPQSDTLTKGSFRAWNGLSDRHEYDLVRVRVDGMHHRSAEINEVLGDLEATYRQTGSVTSTAGGTDLSDRGPASPENGGRGGCSTGEGSTSRGYGPGDAPF